MTINEEKIKDSLSQITTAVKRFAIITAVKRFAIICGSLITGIYLLIIHYSIYSLLFWLITGAIFLFVLIASPFLAKGKVLKLIKKLFISIITIMNMLIIFTIISYIYYPKIGIWIAPGLTKEKILSLKLGMDKDEVINILGEPIQTFYDGRNLRNLLSYLSGYFIKSEHIRNGHLVYADPGLFEEIAGTFEFALGISNNKLSSIVIERGDYGIYVCYKNGCPGMINLEALEELCLLSHK